MSLDEMAFKERKGIYFRDKSKGCTNCGNDHCADMRRCKCPACNKTQDVCQCGYDKKLHTVWIKFAKSKNIIHEEETTITPQPVNEKQPAVNTKQKEVSHRDYDELVRKYEDLVVIIQEGIVNYQTLVSAVEAGDRDRKFLALRVDELSQRLDESNRQSSVHEVTIAALREELSNKRKRVDNEEEDESGESDDAIVFESKKCTVCQETKGLSGFISKYFIKDKEGNKKVCTTTRSECHACRSKKYRDNKKPKKG